MDPPKPEFVRVEYPGFVKNTERAISTLGGWDVLGSAFSQDAKTLEMRIEPGEGRPLFGEKRSLDGLLVKVKMKTLAPSPSQSIGDTQPVSQTACSIEVLGSVATTYCFDGMADYQYIQAPDDTPWNNTEELLHSNLFARTTDPLRVPPLVFTREDRPDRVYGFKQGAYFKSSTAGQDTSSAAGSDVVKVQRMRMQSCIQISFGDPIPTQPAVTSEDGLSAQQKRIVTVLRDVFKRRPVWLRSQLKNHASLEEFGWGDVSSLLPCVAFKYSNGPYRTTFVRFGYNTTESSSCRLFQVLDFRWSLDDAPTATHVGSGTNISRIMRSVSAAQTKDGARTSKLYQLCDLKEASLVDVIQSAPIRKECDKQEGWFADGVLQQLRVLMKEHLRTKLGATSDSSAMLAPTKKRRRQEGQRKQAITASIMGRLTVQQQQQPQLMPTSPVFPQVDGGSTAVEKSADVVQSAAASTAHAGTASHVGSAGNAPTASQQTSTDGVKYSGTRSDTHSDAESGTMPLPTVEAFPQPPGGNECSGGGHPVLALPVPVSASTGAGFVVGSSYEALKHVGRTEEDSDSNDDDDDSDDGMTGSWDNIFM